ncbi:MAG: prominin family protein [Acidimicrobiia bacterium]|nr:prominin family protein [Acidimicrobiia bacterium]
MADGTDAYFRETQRLPGWAMALVIVSAGSSIAIFAVGFYVQLVRGEPWGNNPMSDGALIAMGAVFIVIGIALILLFATLRLITVIHTDAVQIRFAPMRTKRIPLVEVASVEIQTIRPIRDFGGWGVRYRRGVKAYIASGDRAVRLNMLDGRDIVIGSQQPHELEAAIRTWLGR